MRARILVFAAVVAIALALNLARLSLSIGQTGEDTLRARLAMATSALKAQLDLVDARLPARAVAQAPDLIEATRAESGPGARPDERALRAAASALSPEPDLVAVASPQGAIVSRRGKPVAVLDSGRLPLARAALEGNPAPAFAPFEGLTWRVAAARVPGNPAAAVVGMLVDDRFAQQLKSQVDADVTLLQGGKVIASSLPAGDRPRVVQWVAAPGAGYGVLRVILPLVGTDLSGKLPRGASRFAVRGALVAADGGVQVALTVPASPYFAWLARYQAFYLVGLALFLLFSLVWALLAREKGRSAPAQASAEGPSPSAREQRPAPASPGDVPWPHPQDASRAEEGAPPPLAAREDEPPEQRAGWEEEQAPSEDLAAREQGNGAQASAFGTPPAEEPWGPPAGVASPPAEEPAGFPGDEPSRATHADAALLDKMRERDDLGSAAARNDPTGSESSGDEQDPDETHWRETFDRFKELKARLGEPSDRLSFEKFAARLKKNRADLLAKHNCKGVRFSVYEKEGKAAIKASAVR